MSHYNGCDECGCIPCACVPPGDVAALYVSALNTHQRLDDVLSVFRRMAERFDGARNGKCLVCGAGRKDGTWDLGDLPLVGIMPFPCSSDACLSHDIRRILSTEG
jgi:hypothetical protein